MEIEVGEYVRNNRGHIGKLLKIEYDKNDNSLKWYVIDRGINLGCDQIEYINKPYILKHSKNIIDLIEVGDIVIHGDKFISPMEDEVILEHFKEAYTYWKGKKAFYIKSILTHEQYEANCYKVEE